MAGYETAEVLVRQQAPEQPVLCLRPHAAERAARWFLSNFPGTVLYALKANTAPPILDALARAGIRHFDVASQPEIELAAGLANARLSFMNPIKTRETIARAYSEFGVRDFALDSQSELEKILAATGQARDLRLFVRLACPNPFSLMPLVGKYGVCAEATPGLLMKTRRAAARLGVTFHVGSQTMRPEGFSQSLALVSKRIREAGVLIDAIDVGGGFPSTYPDARPPRLGAFIAAIEQGLAGCAMASQCELLCEPGRALVAEAESVLVRIEARQGQTLHINDGAFGTLYDAAHSGLTYPARLVCPGVRDMGAGSACAAFELLGPTCDGTDRMPGPYWLPACASEGDYIEIGQMGAYGRVLATGFNGFGRYDEAILLDEPMASMYRSDEQPGDERRVARSGP